MLDRREVVRKVVMALPERPTIFTSLGNPTFDVSHLGDHPGNFYLFGAMGGAVAMGLGFALAQPQRRVLVVAGDGEMLMGMGSLATVALKQPTNLSILVLDNELYRETGGQATHTAHHTNLAAVAKGCGISSSYDIRDDGELENFMARFKAGGEPMFACAKVRPDPAASVTMPLRSGAAQHFRFIDALKRCSREPEVQQ